MPARILHFVRDHPPAELVILVSAAEDTETPAKDFAPSGYEIHSNYTLEELGASSDWPTSLPTNVELERDFAG